MNLRNVLYIILATISSLLVGGFKEAIGYGTIITGGMLISLVHSQLYKVYHFIIGSKNKNKVTIGLLLSIILSIPLSYLISTSSISYEKQITGDITKVIDVSSYLMPLTYLVSILFCFLMDSFLNNETKKLSKSRIAIGSFSFYILSYGITVILSFVLAIIDLLINWR